jgi:hypothetical protein
MLFAMVRWRNASPSMALARAAEVTDSSTESCLGKVGMADPWPVNERSVLYQGLSALVSAALGENREKY